MRLPKPAKRVHSCSVCEGPRDPRGRSGLCRACHYRKLRERPYCCRICGSGRHGKYGISRVCLDCAKREAHEKRRKLGVPTKAETDALRRKPPKLCRVCRERLAVRTRCNQCLWKEYGPTTARSREAASRKAARKMALVSNEHGDTRRCSRCGLWKKRERHFSVIPGNRTERRRICAACYSSAQSRRNRARGIINGYRNIDVDSWREVVFWYGGLCAYCVQRPGVEHDHVWPSSKGGPTELWNLVPACHACNVRKKNNPGWFPERPHRYMYERRVYDERRHPFMLEES